MKNIKWPLIIFILFTILFISIYIIHSIKTKSNDSKDENINIYDNRDNNESNNIDKNENYYIDTIVNSMSTEQKVGQLFICAFRKDEKNNNMYELSNKAKDFIENYNLGGVILFSENIKDIEQTKKLISDIKNSNVSIPMFLSVDVEGGLVDRLSKSSLYKTLPYISELGKTKDLNLAYEYAKIIARRLAYLGFNLDFAPVCDLDNTTAIKYRSFGKDPEVVSKMIEGYIKGLSEYKISSTLKHFPGLGSSDTDTHENISNSNITLSELEKSDFIPFEKGIETGSNIIMVNHVIYNNLSNIKLPASLNKDIYNILRKNLKFDGIAITDGLEMGAITKQNINTSPAYSAFVAGADMLLLPQDLDKSYNEILNAVKSGEISMQRLNDSARRIIKYKYKSGFFKKDNKNNNIKFYDESDNKILDEIK